MFSQCCKLSSSGGGNVKRFLLIGLALAILFALSSCFLFSLPKTVLLDDIHGYFKTSIEGNFATFLARFQASGYDVFYASEVGFNPSKHGVVVIFPIKESLSSAEVNGLRSQLNKGGKLILLDQFPDAFPASSELLNAITDALGTGMSFNLQLIADNINKHGHQYFPTSTKFYDHVVCSGLEKLVFGTPTHITVTGNAAAVVRAEDTANALSPFVETPEEAASFEVQASPYYYLGAVCMVGENKVIGVSSALAFHDVLMSIADYDNSAFLQNIINW